MFIWADSQVTLGKRATLDGTPLVRRLDLEWPEHAGDGASDTTQYMLGDDLLVAPVDPFMGKYAGHMQLGDTCMLMSKLKEESSSNKLLSEAEKKLSKEMMQTPRGWVSQHVQAPLPPPPPPPPKVRNARNAGPSALKKGSLEGRICAQRRSRPAQSAPLQ